jgi:hypothetical protein
LSVQVGNILPSQEVLVSLTYITPLTVDNSRFIFSIASLPYAPDGKSSPKFASPNDKQGRFMKDVDYGLKIDIELDMTCAITQIQSPSHPISVKKGDSKNRAWVSLHLDDGTPLINDFICQISLEDPSQPCLKLEQNTEGSLVGMFAVFPGFNEDTDLNCEMIFIVDRSGSMSGASIIRGNKLFEISKQFFQ